MSDISLWKPRELAIVPKEAREPSELATFARQLSERDQSQIVRGFEGEHYEMVTNFVWTKAMSALKQRLEALGTQFVGEMLDRPDVIASSSLVHAVSDAEALGLAEDLGMLNSTQALRLRNAMALVHHFTNPPDDADPEEALERDEAVSCLRTTIQAILGHERLDVAVEFSRFRARLEDAVLDATASEVVALEASPYFFRRTTLRVLLALMKNGTGVQLENASGNLTVILPVIWDDLLKADRWDVGRAYAEVHAAGKKLAAAGIRRGLLKVHGFDYVPENLRSMTFLAAANAVLEAHTGFSNFHAEPRPMKALADLGTVIPSPALAKTMTATLSVFLGNFYNISFQAQPYAEQVLNSITAERWLYYLDDCLPADQAILSKLTERKPRKRWFQLVENHDLGSTGVVNSVVRALLDASMAKNETATNKALLRLQASLRP